MLQLLTFHYNSLKLTPQAICVCLLFCFLFLSFILLIILISKLPFWEDRLFDSLFCSPMVVVIIHIEERMVQNSSWRPLRFNFGVTDNPKKLFEGEFRSSRWSDGN